MRRHPPLLRALLLGVTACTAGGDGPVTGGPAPSPGVEGGIWVANLGRGEVLHYDAASGALLEVLDAQTLGQPISPSALGATDDGLLIADYATGDVWAVRAGRAVRRFPNALDGVQLEEPCALRTVGDQALVLGNDSRNLVALGPEAEERREVGDDIRSPHGFDLLPDGDLVVATSPVFADLGLVQIRDRHTGALRHHFAPWPELEEATDVRVDDDTVLVADWFSGQVVRYALDGERLGVLATGLDGPIALAADARGVPLVLTAEAVLALPEGAPPVEVIDGRGRFEWARGLLVIGDDAR